MNRPVMLRLVIGDVMQNERRDCARYSTQKEIREPKLLLDNLPFSQHHIGLSKAHSLVKQEIFK